VESAVQSLVAKAWNEPDLALLKVSVDKAEYWDSPSSKVVRLWDIRQVITGEPMATP